MRKRQTLATAVNCQLQGEADPQTLILPSHQCKPPSNSDSTLCLVKQVATKLEDDDYRGVVHLASFEDAIASLTDEIL